MARRRRWSPLLVPTLAVSAILLAGQPAVAGPSPAAPSVSPPVAATQPGVAAPSLPKPVDVPGAGKVAPFTSKLAPTPPRSLAGQAKPKGTAIDPAQAKAKGSAPRRAVLPNAGPDDPYSYLACEERIQPGISTQPPPANTATISYTADVGCNFYLYYGYGAAAIVDRTPGYDGTFLQISNPFEFYNSYFGSVSGNHTILGNFYRGGRQVEVIFEVYLVTPYGIPWVGCNPLPGLRYLLCDGLGTDVLHVVVGTGALNTNLRPPPVGYTSLGDSFSSGTGAAPYFGVQACRRATTAYPFLIAGLPTLSGATIDQPVHRACHGSTIPQIYQSPVEVNSQLVDVTESTNLATITVGGNDLGFTSKLIACIPGGCPQPIVTDSELVVAQLQLRALYQDIRLRMADDGYLFVLSYPQFLPDPDEGEVTDIASCFGSDVTFSERDLRDIAQATRQVRDMIRRAVDSTFDPRVRFVDLTDVFRGHRVCSDQPYSNGYRFPELGASFHPNARGHQAIAQRLYQSVSLTFF